MDLGLVGQRGILGLVQQGLAEDSETDKGKLSIGTYCQLWVSKERIAIPVPSHLTSHHPRRIFCQALLPAHLDKINGLGLERIFHSGLSEPHRPAHCIDKSLFNVGFLFSHCRLISPGSQRCSLLKPIGFPTFGEVNEAITDYGLHRERRGSSLWPECRGWEKKQQLVSLSPTVCFFDRLSSNIDFFLHLFLFTCLGVDKLSFL
ncbi:unnamed protein product [Pleuronectes platessa]|uniref:Uncharacterized protein n=1 Tax=Pleuronectes platessa TaxID=8262 RepID=A0A9N7YZN2_PLEPL|nr:unnamed protein product [Pleuronectes platessa]